MPASRSQELPPRFEGEGKRRQPQEEDCSATAVEIGYMQCSARHAAVRVAFVSMDALSTPRIMVLSWCISWRQRGRVLGCTMSQVLAVGFCCAVFLLLQHERSVHLHHFGGSEGSRTSTRCCHSKGLVMFFVCHALLVSFSSLYTFRRELRLLPETRLCVKGFGTLPLLVGILFIVSGENELDHNDRETPHPCTVLLPLGSWRRVG